MTHEKATAALDDAFTDGLKRLFDVFVGSSIIQDPQAEQHFKNGIAALDLAHSRALALVETIFAS